MDENIITLAAVIIAAFVSRMVFKMKMGGQTKKERFISNAKRRGNVAQGICVDAKFMRGDIESSSVSMREHSMRCKYEYYVNGVAYYKIMTFQSIGMAVTDYPNEVEVYYDAANPKKAVCPEEATELNHRRSGCYTTIAVFAVVYFAVHLILNAILG